MTMTTTPRANALAQPVAKAPTDTRTSARAARDDATAAGALVEDADPTSSAKGGQDAGRNASKATTNGTNGANGAGASDARSAQAGPFARLMAPADEAANAVPTDEPTPAEPVDVLDAALMQALDGLLGRAPGSVAGTEAAALGVVGAVGEGADGERDATAKPHDDEQPPAGSTPVTLMSMLMPTLLPTAMPPAPAATTDGSSPAAAAMAQPSTASAMATDPARLLSLQAQGVAANDTPATTATSANADGAWQGLQRWSADLMAAMTPAPSAPAAGTGPAPTLALPASRDAWQQPLMQALGDRLQVQIAQRSDSARLHLEPPQLGRIEIDIRQQGGALQVQLSASHDEVRQQLRQIAEPLRHELVQRHAGEVSVQVATGAQAAGDGRGRDGAAGQPGSGGQQREAQRQPGRALGDDNDTAGSGALAFADALDGNTRNMR
ncbi:flagellar hook-length control protein FliK [Roseateles chitosanitabidus]|uniref:flagellar hook-length control protein FliK n=1 Tax=Roseateles chitosanitabidus TaxID=65048 RepID=UPI000831A86D|nr:flagellar hook-length control protein FliK [Roseateles chitosanitabidus]